MRTGMRRDTPEDHRARPRSRRRRLASVGIALAIVAAIGQGAPADAHGAGTPTPADGETVLGTPEKIIVELPGERPVTLELRRSDGTVVPFTGTIERAPGIVRARPPVLEHGTYVIEWRSEDGDGWSTFSVGEPDAVIDGAKRDGRPLPLLLAGLTMLLTGVLLPLRGPRTLHRVIGAAAAAAGVLLLLPPTSPIAAAGGLLLVAGAAGAHLLLAGLAAGPGTRTATDTFDGAADDAARRQTPNAAILAVTGLLLLPAAAAGPALRAVTANPLTAATFLAAGALAILLALLLPLTITGLIAARRGRRPGRLPILATTLVLLLAGTAAALPVDARIERITGDTAPAATCLAGTNRLQIQRCLDASLVAVARNEGVNEALDTLKRLLSAESRARYFCHEASHAIGRESLRTNGTLAAAFRDGYDVCDFGYYHGIVEGAAGGFDDATFLAAVPDLCGEFASAEELFYMQCNHGIGHAAARRTNNDMLRALEFCDALATNPELTGERLRIASNGCGTGVTMEWFATATADPNAAVTPRVSRPRDVCLSVPERWAPECIEYVGNTLDASAPVESLGEIGAWCETTAHTEPCYRGLARAAAGVGIPARDAISVCDAARTTGARDECVTFYIAAVATTIDFDVAAVDRICNELPPADRDGELSICGRVRSAVIEVLAAGDGKPRR